MTGVLLASVHDVTSDTLPAARTWTEELAARGVPATHLVIGAGFEDGALAEWLRARCAAGDEVALHGWTHRADVAGNAWRRLSGTVVARGAGEFWALSKREAAERLARARCRLAASGLEVIGFTPPGWLASPGSVAAAAETGLRYITSHLWISDLTTGRRHRAPAICHRPNSVLQGTAAQVVRSAVPMLIRRGQVARLGLHPADLEHPALVDAALAAVDDALHRGARPLTYTAFLTLRAAEAA